LKLEHEKLLSNFALIFNLRRYTAAAEAQRAAELQAGAYTRSRFSST
jgi:hypothetical protein